MIPLQFGGLGGTVLLGIVLGLFALIGLYIVMFATRIANGRSVGAAAQMSGRQTAAIVGAIFSLIAMVLVNLGEFVDITTQFVASHPFGVSNVVTILLGWAGISGLADISAQAFGIMAVSVAAFALIATEVRG